MAPIVDLLQRSDELDQAMFGLLDPMAYDDSPRTLATATMCDIALEHGHSMRLLVAAGNLTSAITLIRLQFEATTRAIWLLYAASELAIAKLQATLTKESEKAASRQPTINEMISEIAQNGPPAVSPMLMQFKDASWAATNSFVHGGIHAVRRHSDGYPLALVIQVLQNSNGLSTMAAMALTILSGDARIIKVMSRLQHDFRDCLPPLI